MGGGKDGGGTRMEKGKRGRREANMEREERGKDELRAQSPKVL